MTTGNGLVRVAVDVMGGDHSPCETVAGALAASAQGDIAVLLVGDPDVVEAELAKHNTTGLPIVTVPSEGMISEAEPPAMALRQKPHASILVATGLVKHGKADALVSMGSTGAAMVAAAVVLGVTEGIDRPAIGGPIIGLAPRTVIIDVGSNLDCRPEQLLSFAIIGDVFARIFWSIDNPRVGLLSVGSESGKGNRQVKAAADLIANSNLNFIGNVEANDLPFDVVEVLVCDGFVGNIVMKLTEGLGFGLSEHIKGRLAGKLDNEDIDSVAREVYELNNVAETFGGGPIYGVNGVSVVGHGRGKADSVQRAISMAKHSVKTRLVQEINEKLARIRDTGLE